MYKGAAIWKECFASNPCVQKLKENLQIRFAYAAKGVNVPPNAINSYTKVATLCEWQALSDTRSLMKKSEDNLASL